MEELEIYYNNKKLVNDEFLKPSETQIHKDAKMLMKSLLDFKTIVEEEKSDRMREIESEKGEENKRKRERKK